MGQHWVWQIAKEGKLVGTQRSSTWCFSLCDCSLRPTKFLFQVPYIGASARQVEHVLSLLRGRPGKMVDLGSGDGRIVRPVCLFVVPSMVAPSLHPGPTLLALIGAGSPPMWSPSSCGL